MCLDGTALKIAFRSNAIAPNIYYSTHCKEIKVATAVKHIFAPLMALSLTGVIYFHATPLSLLALAVSAIVFLKFHYFLSTRKDLVDKVIKPMERLIQVADMDWQNSVPDNPINVGRNLGESSANLRGISFYPYPVLDSSNPYSIRYEDAIEKKMEKLVEKCWDFAMTLKGQTYLNACLVCEKIQTRLLGSAANGKGELAGHLHRFSDIEFRLPKYLLKIVGESNSVVDFILQLHKTNLFLDRMPGMPLWESIYRTGFVSDRDRYNTTRQLVGNINKVTYYLSPIPEEIKVDEPLVEVLNTHGINLYKTYYTPELLRSWQALPIKGLKIDHPTAMLKELKDFPSLERLSLSHLSEGGEEFEYIANLQIKELEFDLERELSTTAIGYLKKMGTLKKLTVYAKCKINPSDFYDLFPKGGVQVNILWS